MQEVIDDLEACVRELKAVRDGDPSFWDKNDDEVLAQYELAIRVLQGFIWRKGPVPEDGWYFVQGIREPLYYTSGRLPPERISPSNGRQNTYWHGPIIRLEEPE